MSSHKLRAAETEEDPSTAKLTAQNKGNSCNTIVAVEKLQRGETSAISEVALGSLSHSLTNIFTESLTSYIYITWIISSLGHSLHTTTKTKSPASPLYADKSILQVLFKNYKSCLSFQKEKQCLYTKLHGIIKAFWFTSGHSAACFEKQVV